MIWRSFKIPVLHFVFRRVAEHIVFALFVVVPCFCSCFGDMFFVPHSSFNVTRDVVHRRNRILSKRNITTKLGDTSVKITADV